MCSRSGRFKEALHFLISTANTVAAPVMYVHVLWMDIQQSQRRGKRIDPGKIQPDTRKHSPTSASLIPLPPSEGFRSTGLIGFIHPLPPPFTMCVWMYAWVRMFNCRHPWECVHRQTGSCNIQKHRAPGCPWSALCWNRGVCSHLTWWLPRKDHNRFSASYLFFSSPFSSRLSLSSCLHSLPSSSLSSLLYL